MRNIKGNYVDNNKEIPFDIDIPSTWDELEKFQFARIIEILHFRKADQYTVSVSLLALLAGVNNWKAISSLPAEYQAQLIPLTNFLFEENPPVHNFFPYLKINKRKCVPPNDDLGNLSFGEWCFAHQFYIYYSTTQDPKWLNKLIATLYRPVDPVQDIDSADYSGDLRERFNENLIDKRSLSVGSIANHMKLGVLTWFSCAVREIASTRKNLFPQPEPIMPGVEASPSDSKNDGKTWFEIFRDQLGSKWGTPEQLKFTNALFIIDDLEEKHVAFKESKRPR